MILRVLFVTRTTVYGGAEKHLVDLVSGLGSPGIECTIVCYGTDVFSPYLGGQGNVRIVCLNAESLAGFWSCWVTLRGLAPHTVVFNNSWLGIFPWHAYLAARLSGSRRVFPIEHSTGDHPPPAILGTGLLNALRRCWGWRTRLMWRLRLPSILSDKTICVSNSIRERLVVEYGYSKSKTVAILNGVNLRRYVRSSDMSKNGNQRSDLGLPPGELLLCVANLTRVKRIDVLLEAVRIVSENHPSCRCIIVGGGHLESVLRTQSKELGLADIVRFVGHVEDVRPYYEVADLFLLSSDNEGLPLVLGEAMAYGVPCVATDVGGNNEIVVHGQTGLLVKSGSPDQLAETIEFFLTHPEERRRMGANAQQRVQKHFNIEDSMSQLRDILIGESIAKPMTPDA